MCRKKMINVNHFTITWNVYGLNISHVGTNEVTNMIDCINIIYGDNTRLSRGNKHDYLGMDLEFSHYGDVRVKIIEYLKKVILDFLEQVSGKLSILKVNNLFRV